MKLGVGARSLAVLAAGALLAGAVWARATPDELARLGKSLTCTGGEKAGTASGVPEFTGKWLGTPPGIQYNPHAGQRRVDFYASEKPCSPLRQGARLSMPSALQKAGRP